MTPDLDTEEEIMSATYRALCRTGYASLTMQDIADESSKSKAALHYHYDTKHDLLVAFLDYINERFSARIESVEADDPVGELLASVDTMVEPPESGGTVEFRTAMLELRAQAPYDDEYRDRLARFDQFVQERVRRIVEDGIESGVFRSDVDPAETATFVATIVNGAYTRRAMLDSPRPVRAAKRAVREHARHRLVADRGVLEK